jgi:hypothetical protein
MRDESLDPVTRMEAAKAAAPYVYPRMAPPAEPIRTDFVALAERLKAYARRDATEAGNGKVVELKVDVLGQHHPDRGFCAPGNARGRAASPSSERLRRCRGV